MLKTEEDMSHHAVYFMLKHERLAQLRGQATVRETDATWPAHATSRQTRRTFVHLPNAQLLYLFMSSFIILFVGMGLFPVLPVYATEFGASRTVIGLYYALMYAANAAGAMLTNRLAARLTYKGLFVAMGALGIPALLLLGQASALWQVVVLTTIVWFCGGVGLALVNVFTGQQSGNKSRGKSFSLMFLAFPLGAVFGGTLVGRLVTTAGYHSMFVVLGAVWAILPAIGIFKLKIASDFNSNRTATTRRTTARLGTNFYRMLAMTLLASVAINTGRLGTALSMQTLGFSAGAISSTAIVSGLVSIPIVLLIGALSDRLGRQTFLMLGYVSAASGALMLALAAELWMFWLAATLVLVALCTSGALASALMTDTLSPQARQRGLPWINAMNPVAGVLSFTSIGFLMDAFGPLPVYLLALTAALGAALLLNSLRGERSSDPVSGEVCQTRNALGQCLPAEEAA
jgi:AAHS family 4-hydroxybenzoate transporter-like MFS transporter